MSGDANHGRRRRPPRMYVVESDYKVQDHLEGTIRLQRGQLCQEQEEGGKKSARGEYLWVKVIDNGSMVKIDTRVLAEVRADFAGLLEPVRNPEERLRLLAKPHRLQRLASLALGSEVWVYWNQSREFAEADLRFRGPLTRGSSGVYFGVQLKGWAAGKGKSNGNYKGHQFFICPDGCGLILSASELTVPRLSRTSSSGDHDRQTHQAIQTSSSNAHQGHGPSPVSILSRAAESSPPALFSVGQRVCFMQGDAVRRGSVRFCGSLPDRPSSEVFVGVLLDHAVGSWDGVYKNTKLCSIPSAAFGALLPLSHVTAETGSERSPPTAANPKALPKLPQLPPSNNTVLQPLSPTHDKEPTPTDRPLIQPAMLVTAKKALQPPSSSVIKVALKPPPLTAPKPPLKPPALPPNKPQALPKSPTNDPSRSFNNGFHSFPSPPPVVEQKAGLDTWFEVGSMVEVNDPPLFGVIRWIGQISGVPEPVAGIELDQEMSAATDGSYLGERHFRCPANKGLFVKLRNCRRDSRFPAPETPINQVDRCNSIAFANWSSQRVDENTPPVMGLNARVLYEGFKKGIQGHLNSCYLDASLFSVFSCCSSVDWVLFWPTEPQKNPHCRNAQDLLRCEIVNPLRRSASRRPQECFIYQLFPPSVSPTPSSPGASPASPSLSPLALSSLMRVSSVQMLLESSFMHSGLKLTEAPSCLPLLMPRFGKEFKMFDMILTSLSLDITDLLDETVRQCSICQSLAQWECLQCYEDDDITPGQLKQGPQGSWEGPVTCVRQLMDLFAVTCIETSHYVSFVKYGPHATDWLFFDSMADREGGENGFNVPQVRACPEVGRYLSLSVEEISRLDASTLRDPVRRMLCDAYMCFYHCPELSLYK
ncbi:Ubiquitin carboxyl-terminal hydrolase CYLD [Triplophysa tibetana]|uniref:ubiquitinyl hydrolase 1 n=1 Tax=Triplophysa tibetana TaxID=1572043 RepID=A0A5A9PTK7_9TELE|nr:Ubiquitin carboxyl-terminal hydrolase CYLD [Triplophysa tibetana]